MRSPRRSLWHHSSIFLELSPRSKLSAWQQFNRNVLLRGCAWLDTRSATSKKKSPSVLPALEFSSRMSLAFNSPARESDGNREPSLNKWHVSDQVHFFRILCEVNISSESFYIIQNIPVILFCIFLIYYDILAKAFGNITWKIIQPSSRNVLLFQLQNNYSLSWNLEITWDILETF